MILDQLVEKKDLLIYIDLRIKHLQKLYKIENNKLIVNNFVDPLNVELSINQLKSIEKMKRRWNAQIQELMKLKSLLSEGTLKNQCKNYWNQRNK